MDDYEKTRLLRQSLNEPPPLPYESVPGDDSDKTRILDRPEPDSDTVEPSRVVTHHGEDRTVILSPPARIRAAAIPVVDDIMADPIVGWLVVVAGPGRGNILKLGHGMNSIGRAEGQRCCIDFGDTEISRKTHATVTYDPRGRNFYLMHGGGQNLTYMGNAPVLQPVMLKGGELISMGRTTLKFVPLCGPDFDWSQQME